MTKRWAALAAIATIFVSACNTIYGAGQDVEAAGEEIQETSQEVAN